MAAVKACVLEYGDVVVTATAFSVFYEDYRRREGIYHLGLEKAQPVTQTPHLVEYTFCFEWYEYDPPPTQWVYNVCPLIRFRALPYGRQEVSLHIGLVEAEGGFHPMSDECYQAARRAATSVLDSFMDWHRSELERISDRRDVDGGTPKLPRYDDSAGTWREWYERIRTETGHEVGFAELGQRLGLSIQSPVDKWFEAYHVAKDVLGFRVTLKEVADCVSLSKDYVSHLHPNWKRTRGKSAKE